MPCMQCPDGTIQCGPNPKNLCAEGPGGGTKKRAAAKTVQVRWQDAGVIGFHLYVARDAGGGCKIKVEPCVPLGKVRCQPVVSTAKRRQRARRRPKPRR